MKVLIKNHLDKNNLTDVKSESGYTFAAFSIVVTLILGSIMSWLSTGMNTSSEVAVNNISSSQAYWHSLSGMELKVFDVINEQDFNNYIFNDFTVLVEDRDSVIVVISEGRSNNHYRQTSVSFQRVISDIFDDNLGSDYTTGLVTDDFEITSAENVQWWITDDSTFFNNDIMNNSSGSIFVSGGPGGHLKTGMTIDFPAVENASGEFSISLAAGKDSSKPLSFSSKDHFKIYVNDVLFEHFTGKKNNQPLFPTLGTTSQNVIENFQEFTFNVGNSDSVQISFEIEFSENLYLGIDNYEAPNAGTAQAVQLVQNTFREI